MALHLIKTESGSSYFVDTNAQRVVRVEGVLPPTERQGVEWQSYSDLHGPDIGKSMIIIWRYEDGVAKSTMTSAVVSIAEVSIS